MQFSLHSLNVQGLNNPTKINRLKGYIKYIKPSHDFLFIQEHKLTSMRAANLDKSLNNQAAYLFTKVEPSYNNSKGKPRAGYRGMALLVNSRWKKYIATFRSLFNRRASWIILKDFSGSGLGIFNLYFLNDQ